MSRSLIKNISFEALPLPAAFGGLVIPPGRAKIVDETAAVVIEQLGGGDAIADIWQVEDTSSTAAADIIDAADYQSLIAAGAIDITHDVTRLGAHGAGAVVTVANGTYLGQEKWIYVDVVEHVGTDTMVVTPVSGGPWTVACVGDYLRIKWNGTSWLAIVDRRFGVLADIHATAASAAAGTSTKVAHADHVHAVGSGSLGAVGQIADVGITTGAGASGLAADASHVHKLGTAVFGTVGSVADVAHAASVGTVGNALAAALDHAHKIPAAYFTASDLASMFAAGAKVATHPGAPMINRVRMLGAPGAIVQGDTVVIGADTYEFRSSTPPLGGTAGRIWVYNGAASVNSRTNFIDAVNGVVDTARISRTPQDANAGTNTELKKAASGITTGDIIIASADAIGGNIAASAVATNCTETLTTATDIWDQVASFGGVAEGVAKIEVQTITVIAAMIAKANVQFVFTGTPRAFVVHNRMRPQNELYALSGTVVTLACAGAGSPNNQPNDVIDCIAIF